MSARSRRRPILALLLFNAVVIVALDQIAGSREHVDLTASFRRRQADYHHDLRPSVRATMPWGARRVEVVTNSLAFRDETTREVSAARGDRPRILLLGDSFTEGVGVDWQESFAGLLASELAGEVEILNAGVIGYSPKIYALKFAHLLDRVQLEVDELVVFIDMSDIPNEIIYATWEPGRPDVHPSPPPGFWARFRQRSLTLRALDQWRGVNLTDVAWNFHGMPFADDLDAVALSDPAFDDQEHWTLAWKYAQRGMEYATRHMDALASLCADRGIPLTIVVYPWPANILAGELDHPQVELWRSFSEERGVRFIDLFPVFIHDGYDPAETVARYFIAGDVHWNAAGHERVAAHMAPLLAERARSAE
ncbi:MAG: SGNH/GDSL hydrolase family protein [Myxococcota bacterium]